MAIYVFGASGQDGTLLRQCLHSSTGHRAPLVLFDRKSVTVEINRKRTKTLIGSEYHYLGLVKDLFENLPPDKIFYLAAVHKSSQELSNPSQETSSRFANLQLPKAIISEVLSQGFDARFVYASSCLVFANSHQTPQNELTERSPACTYANHKVEIESYLQGLIDNGNLLASTCILYNHESHLRKKRFFTGKVISHAFSKHLGQVSEPLVLQNPGSRIDMGYALDYVKAMQLLADRGSTGTYVVGTGKHITVKNFVETVYKYFSIPMDDVIYASSPPRSGTILLADARRLRQELNWRPTTEGNQLVRTLCADYSAYYSSKKLHM